FYSYRSSTIKTVTLVSKDELKVLRDQGKGLPIESYSKTGSPISLDIDTASPIRTYGDSVEFPIVITIKNVGGGTVCPTIYKCKKVHWQPDEFWWYKLDLEIHMPPGMELRNCNKTESVMLIGDTPQSLSCKVTADTGHEIGIVQKNIELRSEYGYFVDKTTNVFVYPSALPKAAKE
ncbi:MAG: hypothetical protein JSV39_00025, partial [Candidatus Aenigmatarchaeota archaeon]